MRKYQEIWSGILDQDSGALGVLELKALVFMVHYYVLFLSATVLSCFPDIEYPMWMIMGTEVSLDSEKSDHN